VEIVEVSGRQEKGAEDMQKQVKDQEGARRGQEGHGRGQKMQKDTGE